MKRSDNTNRLMIRGLLWGLATVLPWNGAFAQNAPANRPVASEGLDIPAPHVRRRVPIKRPPAKRSRVSSYQADRARQALMHSQPKTQHYVPKHERLASAEVPIQPIPQATALVNDGSVTADPVYIEEGDIPNAPSYADEVYDDQVYADDQYYDDSGYADNGCDCGQCGGGNCGGGSCDCGFDCGGGCGGCDDLSGYPFGALWGMGNLEAFVGGVGFVGPYNQGDSGSFGFQEGFNFGTVLPFLPYSGFGWQIGTRSTQTNLSGADFTPEERQQTFFTTGVFKRACAGWQGGLVVDVLQDEWFAEANVTQLRGELSFRFPSVHEFGYRFSASLRDEQVGSPITAGQTDTYESFDLHSLFYRRRLTWAAGGQVTLFGGLSSEDDGYIGTDLQMPLSDFFSVRSSLSYLIPDNDLNDGTQEAWNASIMLVFNLRGARPGARQAKFSPLLDVADNGNFILNRIAP